MGLLRDCKKYFDTEDLYEVLKTSKDASESELKKAYKRMSLVVHPDRADASNVEEATRKFQVLSKVHFILSDKDRRALYDETGSVDDEYVENEKNWSEYWRLLFPRITVKDIEDFENKYKGSEEEREDLKQCYLDCEGDMNKMCEHIILYNYSEEKQYRSIIENMIASGDIPDFPAFTKESNIKKQRRRRRFEKEAAEVEQMNDSNHCSQSDLVAAIACRAESRKTEFDNMIANLEQKYAKKPGNKKAKVK